MEGVYTDYFQKSKVFLYPLLNLKKGMDYVPIQTYVCWEHTYVVGDHMLLCEYHAKNTDKFIAFCDRYLKSHVLFSKYVDLGDNKHVFIFDFKSLKNDFNRFIKGNYSQFSLDSKLIILDFFSTAGSMLVYITSFLSPDDAHENYANALGVDVESIQDVYEVCSIPDLDKETFHETNEILISLLNKNSIYLDK
jgi:hypothetical protein|tara:strand:- start:3220 stop:3798 length:579 start_codon:yes stop_codon:yes gene_type:complete